MRLLSAVVVLVLSGCAHQQLTAVRETVSQQTGCPQTSLHVKEVHDGWFATGCETRYFCQATNGPCAEDPTPPQRLARARSAFSKETQCPLADVSVNMEPRGFGASGCGRYSVCAGYDGPCMPQTPPRCADLAKWRFDNCTAEAHDTASHDRASQNYYSGSRRSVARAIVGNITASNRETEAVAQCRSQFDAESRLCPP